MSIKLLNCGLLAIAVSNGTHTDIIVEMFILITAYALECKICFLSEQRTELYKWYREGVAQLKNVFGAKNGLQSRALLDLGRRVA